jgi:hypothetical protein
VLAYTWPAARLGPRHLPIGVVGFPAGSQHLVDQSSAQRPGAFDVHPFADAGAAQVAIKHRRVYGVTTRPATGQRSR